MNIRWESTSLLVMVEVFQDADDTSIIFVLDSYTSALFFVGSYHSSLNIEFLMNDFTVSEDKILRHAL